MPDLFDTGDVDLKKILNSGDTDLISRMKSIMGPFILRRLKADVMEQLVPKIQEVYKSQARSPSLYYQFRTRQCLFLFHLLLKS